MEYVLLPTTITYRIHPDLLPPKPVLVSKGEWRRQMLKCIDAFQNMLDAYSRRDHRADKHWGRIHPKHHAKATRETRRSIRRRARWDRRQIEVGRIIAEQSPCILRRMNDQVVRDVLRLLEARP